MHETVIPTGGTASCHFIEVCRCVGYDELPDFKALTGWIVIRNFALDGIVVNAGELRNEARHYMAIGSHEPADRYRVDSRPEGRKTAWNAFVDYGFGVYRHVLS